MKTSVQSVLLTACFLVVSLLESFACTTYPTDDITRKASALQVSVFPANSTGAMYVNVVKTTGKQAVVRIISKDGLELDRQYVRRKEAICRLKFDLDNLGDGQYAVEVTDGKNKSEHPFVIATQAPVVTPRQIKLL